MRVWRVLVSVLLAGASVGAVIRSADASVFGRFGGVFAALSMVLVAIGVARGATWAFGVAFFLGIFWFWAVLALRLGGEILGFEVAAWLAWSIVVMVGSVRARAG